MKKVINKTVIRDHKGEYKDYFQSVYFENIDENTIKNVTAIFICNDVKIIWRLY